MVEWTGTLAVLGQMATHVDKKRGKLLPVHGLFGLQSVMVIYSLAVAVYVLVPEGGLVGILGTREERNSP